MQITLLTQPFDDGADLRHFLELVAADRDVLQLTIVVAWAKRSGFRQVGDLLATARRNGARVQMIVGISEGGATRQGLEAVIEAADEAFIYHVPGRTFHPKLYLATRASGFKMLVGSHNLTRGGAVENFELGVSIDSDTSDEQALALHTAATVFVDRLLADASACLPLDASSLDLLLAAGYRIGDEDETRRATDSPWDVEEVDHDPLTGGLFTGSDYSLRRGRDVAAHDVPDVHDAEEQGSDEPPTAGDDRVETAEVASGPKGDAEANLDEPSAAVSPNGSTVSSAGEEAHVVRRWIKQLPRSDAQRLGGNSNSTGHVTLVRGRRPRNPIGEAPVWFRQVFFARATWVAVPGSVREQTVVPFHVYIDEVHQGVHRLVVDDNPDFGSGQSNREVTLRWGDDLNDYLARQVDRSDDYLSLEEWSDGSYQLHISGAPTGPPIA